MRGVSHAALTLLVLGAGARTAAAQQGTDHWAFLLLRGGDTVVIENVTRSTTELRSSLETRALGKSDLIAALTPDLLVSRISVDVFPPGTQQPAASATLVFANDSVTAEIPDQGQRTVATQRGAEPWVNPSFALAELIIQRARKLGGDPATVPLFLVQGGNTIPATVRKIGADSASLTIAGVELRVHTDASGRILGARIPSQGSTIVRVASAQAGMHYSKADYSAPANAPYTAEEVRVTAPGGYTLAGTLTMPKAAAGPVPAVVTITGSGLEDRDEALPIAPGYRPFRQIADTLGRRGIAVLRLDDRGFGESTGNAATATSADFADDIRAALEYLRTRKDIDPRRLFLVGHSEGGVIAPMIAATDPSLRGIVLMAGSARKGIDVVRGQVRYLASLDTSLTPARRDSVVTAQYAALDSSVAHQPWMRFFATYDPITTAKRVRVPVLVLQGANDKQVTPDQARMLGDAFRAGGNTDVTVHVFPDVDHLFLRDPSGNPMGYAKLPSKNIPPDVLGTIADWITKHSQ
jgi:dienelactone hydrolase